MAERVRVWTDDELCYLLAAWSNEFIQCELNGSFRKESVWTKIPKCMKAYDFIHTSAQVLNKLKLLKKLYKDEVDKLRKSGVGLESDDEDDLIVCFKWFILFSFQLPVYNARPIYIYIYIYI